MAKPLNQREHQFCSNIVEGLKPPNAYVKAGYASKGRHSNVARMMEREHIQAAIANLRERLEAGALISAERVIEELARIGLSNILDYIRILDNGDPEWDLSAMTREQAAAISSIEIDTYMDGDGPGAREVKRIKVKLYDKAVALRLIGQYFGIFVDRVHLSADDNIRSRIVAGRARAMEGREAAPVIEHAPAVLAGDEVQGAHKMHDEA